MLPTDPFDDFNWSIPGPFDLRNAFVQARVGDMRLQEVQLKLPRHFNGNLEKKQALYNTLLQD